MKPLYLRISGFGPFPGTHEIPLEKMGEAGVFLVTGDTGSGKTTIFDAICFALYGETSGGVRNPEQLRSQYCEPMTETSVELSFLCRDKFYRVYRNLEYKRKKLYGDGMTVEGKNATLYSEDGTVLAERVEAVNAKIIEITGMRANQFRQIIMIAQGAFQKFLFSSSTEKEDILRQLFQTYACKSVQELLKSKTDDAAQVVQNEEREICYALHQIAPLDEEAAGQYQLLLERDGAAVAAELCQMLQQSGETAAAQLRSLTAEKQKRQKTSDTLLQEIERGKAHNQTLRQLEENAAALAQAEAACTAAEQALRRTEAETAHLPEKQEEYTLLSYTMPMYQQVAQRQEFCKSQQLAQERKKQALLRNQQEQEQRQKKMQALSAELEQLGNLAAELAQEQHTMEQLHQRQEILAQLKTLLRQCEKEAELLHQCQTCADHAHQVYFQKEKPAYDRVEQQFFQNMAGNLARQLQPDTPCPVCGSLKHPDPAVCDGTVVTEDEFKTAQKNYRKAQEVMQQQKHQLNVQEERCRLLQAQCQEFAEKNGVSQDAAALQQEQTALTASVQIQQQKLNALQAQLNRERQARSALQEQQQRLPEVQAAGEALQGELQTLETSIAAEQAQLTQMQSELQYATLAEAQQHLQALESEIRRSQERQKQAAELLQAQREKLTGLQEIAAHLQQAAGEAPAYPVAQKEQEWQALRRQLDQMQQKLHALENHCTEAEKIAAQTAEQADILQRHAKTAQRYRKLYRMITGQQGGTERISFERFVQTYYFNQVLEQANQKLYQLSGGRYQFVRRQDEKKRNISSGLNLDILDFYTDRSRAVETLSGGETFLASLSLALGLSDTVQQQTGGIQMDAMFIDEGFGSLDSTALDHAIRLLEQLSDHSRMIGIISHVSELSDRFENQIRVEKTPHGSRITCIGQAFQESDC